MSELEEHESVATIVDASVGKLVLPSEAPDENVTLDVPFGAAIAFIGPNGAGKSRMAAWMDRNNHSSLYLRARRSVVMPKSYSVSPEESEYASILAGQRMDSNIDKAKQIRYSQIGDRDYFADDDFQRVLNILGSRHATDAVKFSQNYDPANPPFRAPTSELDKAISIWEFVLPHLKIDSSNVPTLSISNINSPESDSYSPKELSDGEKAIFYLIGKSMIAPSGSIVIVDEPEMYVHRSVRNILWDRIEKARRDCIFVYFTHDLDFVRTRQFHQKYVVHRYIGKPREGWLFSAFPGDSLADETLQMTVWGHRQPTLLVEGSFTSLDLRILSLAFTGFLIVPAGSCDDIRHSVAALRKQRSFHHQDIFGIIDRDVRPEDEVAKLRKKKVYCLPFKEVENLLVSSEMLLAIGRLLGKKISEIKNLEASIHGTVRKKISKLSEERSLALTRRRLINLFEEEIIGASTPSTAAKILQEDRITAILDEIRSDVFRKSNTGTWNELLSLYSVRKDNFGSVISDAFGFKNFEFYKDAVMRMVESEDANLESFREAVRKHLPKLSS